VKRTLFALSLILLAASSFAADFGSDEQALRSLDHEMAMATYMGNTKWFREHLADDYVLITAGGAIKTKAQLIAPLDRDAVRIERFEPTEVTLRAYGSTAIMSGRMVHKYNEGGERVTADLRYSQVWIKTDEGWVAISGQESPVSVKREPIAK
jgi:ketosteroid isomerase-like protein